jgi:phosphatidylinositol 3-kinase
LQPSFQPFPLPLKPSLTVNGLLANVQIFKSAKKPIKLTFTTSTNDNFSILYKVGDDLRQDQLVLQLISLMDRLLKKENLDLKLLPYRVLATSLKEGMIEFVPNACSLSSIRNNYNRDIASFLRKYNSDTNGPFGIKESVFDTYVKSCAGYCVITYILGVGDRHLDNILITTSGNFFHIDFGYIFGRDPKGLVSPMRIPREVVEAMGGQNSKYYDLFLSLCCEAYNILRKSSNLLLNLILLMIHSNIPQLQGENDLLKVENRLNMHLNDEEAALRMRNLVSESINSFASEFAERLHNLPKLLS